MGTSTEQLPYTTRFGGNRNEMNDDVVVVTDATATANVVVVRRRRCKGSTRKIVNRIQKSPFTH